MFEDGKRYEFRMIEDGGEVTFWGVIASYEHPLIKLADSEPITLVTSIYETGETVRETAIPSHPGRIINVTSPNFVSAIRKDEG